MHKTARFSKEENILWSVSGGKVLASWNVELHVILALTAPHMLRAICSTLQLLLMKAFQSHFCGAQIASDERNFWIVGIWLILTSLLFNRLLFFRAVLSSQQKLRRKYRGFLPNISHCQDPDQSGAFVTIDEPTLTHRYHLQSTVYMSVVHA